MRPFPLLLSLLALRKSPVSAWVSNPPPRCRASRSSSVVQSSSSSAWTRIAPSKVAASSAVSRLSALKPNETEDQSSSVSAWKATATLALCTSLLFATSITVSPAQPASAYVPTDYASETVQTALKTLRDASGNVDATVKAYENIAEIIIEGKGVGGQINYQGIALDRGYVADEDTTIYNPGLTLLTESEKTRLVEAVVQSKKANAGIQPEQWNNDAQAGYSFLRERLDPLHMYELRGYLSFVPVWGAVVYLAVLAVQQLARDLFPVAYFVGLAAFVLPAVGLILTGPQ